MGRSFLRLGPTDQTADDPEQQGHYAKRSAIETGDPADDPRQPQSDPHTSEHRCCAPHGVKPVRTNVASHGALIPTPA